MSCSTFTSLSHKDADKCFYEVSLCDDVMHCACCGYFIEKHKQLVVDELINTLPDIPSEITRIKIPLYPLPANKYYYSFDGLSTIVYNLLKTDNAKHKKSVQNHQAFLKLYYERNSLFNIPVIQIEVLFIGILKAKSIDEYWKKLKEEVLFFTGSVGDIDIIEVRGFEHLQELFKIPLIFGYPEFKNEGVLKENGFYPKNIKEMNYLHSMTLLPLVMSKVINDNTLELFSLQKEAINNENLMRTEDDSNLESDDAITAIFGSKTQYTSSLPDEEYDELPF